MKGLCKILRITRINFRRRMTRKKSYGELTEKNIVKIEEKWKNNFGKKFGLIIANIKKHVMCLF